ncbi:MAG: M55 family metallopeptidase [Clostridia bacterium]|nr:M55 family metallopeptidase [Clostridia bacterium]
MRYLIMTDIEGVTGVTSYAQAENSQFGKDMLMNDLLAVIHGIRRDAHHEIVVYDMHTDGRNIDITQLPDDVQVVVGKPINGEVYRGIGGHFDGLFLVGLHAMGREKGAMLAHSYLVQYDAIHINGKLVGEIGVEALLAGEQGIPLVFVSGDDMGCREAERLIPNIVTATVKKSLGDAQALCLTPARTSALIEEAAAEAVVKTKDISPKMPEQEICIDITFSDCKYLENMKKLYASYFVRDNVFEYRGVGMLKTWSEYLTMEQEMIHYDQE